MICNNGDYEDEDMIVFCGNCNIPVHQSCYGIEELPDEDWFCYNCNVFCFKKGLMISCALCPKKGGAMKPTNICTPNHLSFRKAQPEYHQNKKSSSKRPGRSELSQTENGVLSQAPPPLTLEELVVLPQDVGLDFGASDDKNLTLNQILRKESSYQADLRGIVEEYKARVAKGLDVIEVQDEENRLSLVKLVDRLGQVELKYLQSEKETQIPDDYSFFLQRNEVELETATTSHCFVPT